MTTPTPRLDFLSVNGAPDPRTPHPREPESQLPQTPHMPGASDSPAEKPLDLGFLFVPPMRRKHNVPEPENMGAKIGEAIRVLGEANIPVGMPGGLQPTPHLEEDDDYRMLEPHLKVFLRVLEKSGRVTKAAEVSGMGRGAAYALKRRDKTFAKLWQRAISYRAELLEDEAIRRAVGGVKEDVYYMGGVCGSKTNYSDALLSKLLEGNMPEKYRQNHKIELEGKMAVATLVLPATTSAADWAAQNSGTIIDAEPEDEYAV